MAAIPHMVHTMWLDKIQYDNTSCPVKKGVYPAYDLTWRARHPKWDLHLLESTKN